MVVCICINRAEILIAGTVGLVILLVAENPAYDQYASMISIVRLGLFEEFFFEVDDKYEIMG